MAKCSRHRASFFITLPLNVPAISRRVPIPLSRLQTEHFTPVPSRYRGYGPKNNKE